MDYFRQYLSLLNLDSFTLKQQSKKGAKDESNAKEQRCYSFDSRK